MRRLWAIFCRGLSSLFPLSMDEAMMGRQAFVPVEDVMTRGAAAEQLLRNPVMLGALAELEAQIIGQWRGSGADEGDKREWLWLKLRTVDDLPAVLHGYVGAAKVEKDRRDLKDLEEKQGKYK